jgi:hypothetical protein
MAVPGYPVYLPFSLELLALNPMVAGHFRPGRGGASHDIQLTP